MLTQYHNPYDGKRWRLTSQGIEVEHEGLTRTPGAPHTVCQLWEDYGDDFLYASWNTGAPVDMILAMVPIEAVRRKIDGVLRYDPKSDRLEPGYVSDKETPHRRSCGLMQTLISTAQRMADRLGLDLKVTPDVLFEPMYSLLLGAAYIQFQIERYGPDPVLICGAYNAGSLRSTSKNDWQILAYGKSRIDRYVKWYNDFHAALDRELIQLPDNAILSTPS